MVHKTPGLQSVMKYETILPKNVRVLFNVLFDIYWMALPRRIIHSKTPKDVFNFILLPEFFYSHILKHFYKAPAFD